MVQQHIKREEEKQQEIEDAKSGNGPGTQKMSGRRPNARSSKVQAIKESQEEEEKFINKSVVEDNG